MTDRREQILVRLLAIAQGVDGIVTAVRNRHLTDDEEQPAIQILDADELAEANDPQNRPSNAPRLVAMTPEIYVTLGDKAEDVGTAINALRAAFIKAVLTDSDLQSIITHSGTIRYEGCATALSRGRDMQGELGLSFSFIYPLRPAEL
jgi:hypothetical protein